MDCEMIVTEQTVTETGPCINYRAEIIKRSIKKEINIFSNKIE